MTSMISIVQICRTPRLRPRGGPAWSVLRTFSRAVHAGGSDDSNGGMSIYDSLSSRRRALPPNNAQSDNATSSPSPSSPRGMAWYVCGPTVYDSAHLGHGRTYVLLDILRRVAMKWHSSISDGSPRPLYVMNITDVDDKIINRSMELQRNNRGGEDGQDADPIKLARRFEREFWEDMDALNVLRPDVVCRVSEHVESTIVPYIQQIVDGGMAYVIPEGRTAEGTVDDAEGSVYFDVRAFEALTGGRTKYGKLAPDAASTDFYTREPNGNNGEGEGGNNNNDDDGGKLTGRKRDPRDFCLWKYRLRSSDNTTNSQMAPGIEPISVSYASLWGFGRPGWHVECSAMIQRLSEDFASTHEFGMHAGGVDLKFPHHANEIAQAEAYLASGSVGSSAEEFREWIPHWVHTGHLYVKGRKMSKSLKNFVTVREMLGAEQNDDSAAALDRNSAWVSPADDFRLWCLGLSGAYRGPATYSQDRMDEARAIREGWIRFLMEGQECLERWKSIDREENGEVGPTSSTRLWGDEELQLFHDVTKCSMDCRRALEDDLDGASFVKELNRIAGVGLTYVERAKADRSSESVRSRPEEPLRFVLDAFRGQLELVGFSSRTVNAGLSAKDSPTQQTASTTTNAALIDEAVAFRTAVRSASLGAIRKKTNGLYALKEILRLCDEMRDASFPKLGVEILDGKVVEESDGSDANRGWRYCSPRGSERKREQS